MTIKLWLDDERLPPVGWTWAKNYAECVELLRKHGHTVAELSLDHDLAIAHYLGDPTAEKTGYDIALWMVERNVWPAVVRIHSANPVGRERMASMVRRNAPASTTLILDPPGGTSAGTAAAIKARLEGR